MKIKHEVNFRNKILIFPLLIILAFTSSLFASDLKYDVEKIKYEFNHPWSSATLPNGNILVTELSGKIKKINIKTRDVIDINGVPKVLFRGQGGLSDIILHPEFEKNNILFISFSHGKKMKIHLK